MMMKLNIKKINFLNEENYQKIVYDWNRTEHEYPHDRTVADLFEEQAEKTPENTAVVYEGKRVSYGELNEKTNRLGRYLARDYGVGPDRLVALCLDRSELMIVAILGVLKAGGAYVPILPEYPEERIRYIMKDAGAKIIVTNERHEKKLRCALEDSAVRIKSIDSTCFKEEVEKESGENLVTRSGPRDLAYVI
jgi:non-ribosomal peptide synthetase component F